jgi:hypothetical protein
MPIFTLERNPDSSFWKIKHSHLGKYEAKKHYQNRCIYFYSSFIAFEQPFPGTWI